MSVALLKLLNFGLLAAYLLVLVYSNHVDFDDFGNYQRLYIVTSFADDLGTVYKDVGIAYFFNFFNMLGLEYISVVKATLFLFLTIFLIVCCQQKDWVLFCLVVFCFTNRLFIEGAFNFYRSWVVICLFTYLVIGQMRWHAIEWMRRATVIGLAFSFHLHAAAMASVIMLYVIVAVSVIRRRQRLLSIVILGFPLGLSFLLKNNAYLELLSNINGNAVFEKTRPSLSLLYQFYSPLLIWILALRWDQIFKGLPFLVYNFLVSAMYFVYPLIARYFSISGLLVGKKASNPLSLMIFASFFSAINVFFLFQTLY